MLVGGVVRCVLVRTRKAPPQQLLLLHDGALRDYPSTERGEGTHLRPRTERQSHPPALKDLGLEGASWA